MNDIFQKINAVRSDLEIQVHQSFLAYLEEQMRQSFNSEVNRSRNNCSVCYIIRARTSPFRTNGSQTNIINTIFILPVALSRTLIQCFDAITR
jgi:hypothetical protein